MDQIDISKTIKDIFDKNELENLKKFFKKREKLNCWNSYLIYLFYITQSAGILVSSVGTSSNNNNLIWTGVSLNILASLIQIFEKINDSLLDTLLSDIQNIKNGKFIDQSSLININNDFNIKNIE